MSLIQELLAGLEAVDPSKAQQLRNELASVTPTLEPPKPPTILDEVRDSQHDLTLSEIPTTHELATVVGALVKRFYELESHVFAPALDTASVGSETVETDSEQSQPFWSTVEGEPQI